MGAIIYPSVLSIGSLRHTRLCYDSPPSSAHTRIRSIFPFNENENEPEIGRIDDRLLRFDPQICMFL